jgi:hypothetical protein
MIGKKKREKGQPLHKSKKRKRKGAHPRKEEEDTIRLRC